MRQISYAQFFDKVLACWTGKSLGGIIGAPYECHKQFKPADINNLWPKVLYPNDDLDIQVVYLEALQEHGLFIDSKTLAAYWKKHCFYTCCEYGIFINSFDHAIYPPYSGTWNNNWYKSSMGCPIRSELWGILCAGNPALAAKYAEMDGCLDHGPFSVEIERFLSAAAAIAFFDNNVVNVLEEALTVLSAESPIRAIYNDVKAICQRETDVYRAWQQVIRHHGHRNATDARSNFALTLMAIFMGKDDFAKVMHICVESGWDADCTAATAGALLGLVHGSAILPQEWCDKMGKTLVCACEIPHQFASLDSFADETCRLSVEMSQLLNRDLVITGAPQVTIRPQQLPALAIKVDYADLPVLYMQKSSTVKLTLTNNSDKPISGVLDIEHPAHTVLSKNSVALSIAPGKSEVIESAISTLPGTASMPDKNLFNAQFKCSCGKVFSADFGLHGAAQYQVYGPYWDMWDKTKYEVCPYDCEELTCNPGNLPGFRDAMDMYVENDKEYIDETALKAAAIPAENPIEFEKGGFFLYNSDWDGFSGTCCYYLTTELRSSEPVSGVSLGIGSNVPVRAWLDGEEIFRQDHHLCRNGCRTKADNITLDDKPKRLVIKLVARTEKIELSWTMTKPGNSRTEAISPYVSSVEYMVTCNK